MAKTKRKQAHPARDDVAIPPSPTSIPHELPPPVAENMSSAKVPLLICSIGNPGATYAHTLHSAGHTLLNAVYHLTGTEYTKWAQQRSWGGGTVSFPKSGGHLRPMGYVPAKSFVDGQEWSGGERTHELWTFWVSGSFMNVSGKGVAEAFKRWRMAMRSARYPTDVIEASKVVILHDELEKPVGKFVVRKEKSSLKGHNGLKSIHTSLGGMNFIRIGVGIDRPVSRDPEDVSRHVLRKMTVNEKAGIESCAQGVLEALEDITEGK